MTMRSQGTKTALAAVAVVALGIAFWVLLLGPKRDEADRLSKQADALRSQVAMEETRAAEGLAAKKGFPVEYRQLIELGKAVPGDAETASLLVQLNRLGRRAKTDFEAIKLSGGEAGGGAPPPEESASATEGEVALAPIGAGVGPAGFLAMPYELEFSGSFFALTKFIHGIDAQVKTAGPVVVANGRLMTIDGFVLTPGEGTLASDLEAHFNVTTFVVPPGQGLTGGATEAGPEGGAL